MALGRGLDSLIPRDRMPLDDSQSSQKPYVLISTDLIKPNPNQPREYFDEEKLQELAESIKIHGVIEPLLVKKQDNEYLLVAGERRWRAASLAGVDKIPAICSDYSDEEILELSIIENIQREDLNVIEQAKGYQTLLDNFGYTQEQLAERLGKSRTYLTNILRILKLPESIQSMILEGVLSYSSARVLLALEDEEKQLEIAQQILDKNLNVRETERLVKQAQENKEKPKVKEPDPYIEDLEKRLSQKMDAKVEIKNSKNKGKIEIRYSSLEHLNAILSILDINQEYNYEDI